MKREFDRNNVAPLSLNGRVMKTLLLLIPSVTIIQLNTYSQGTINFSNLAGPRGSSVNAPVTNVAGNRIIGPAPYVADLFWSSDTNTPVDSLTAAGFDQAFSTSTLYGGGYFIGASETLPAVGWIQAQVRVWDTTYGSTYAQARDNGGEFGYSNPILVLPSIPPGPSTDLVGLRGFQLQIIPEPSGLALGALGGLALLLFRGNSRG